MNFTLGALLQLYALSLSHRVTPFSSQMSKLLQTPHLFNIALTSHFVRPSATSYRHRFSVLRYRPRATTTAPFRSFSARAFDSDDTVPVMNGDADAVEADTESGGGLICDDKYPSGEFRMKEFGWWMTFLVKLRMLIALPWKRVAKGSVLTMKLRGQISDQLKSRFSSGLSLPQICENFEKAAYDPRIAGIYIHFEPLNCGWAKVEEIRRHILNFKQSGKFIVGYVPVCREKEYYLACACDELYAPPSAYFSLYGMAV